MANTTVNRSAVIIKRFSTFCLYKLSIHLPLDSNGNIEINGTKYLPCIPSILLLPTVVQVKYITKQVPKYIPTDIKITPILILLEIISLLGNNIITFPIKIIYKIFIL